MNCGTIKISFTGDVMCEYNRLHDYMSMDGKYDFSPLFKSCIGLFSESDYVVANLETPIAGEKLSYSFRNYNFNTPESILYAMKDSGINMVTTANNHVLDRGVEGIDNTIRNIKESGLDYTGTTLSECKPTPLIKEIGTYKIGFLSYTYGTEACHNGDYLVPKEQYRVNLLKNQELYNPIQRYFVLSRHIIPRGCRFFLKTIFPQLKSRGVEDWKQSDKRQKEHLISDISYCKDHDCDKIIMCLHSGGQFNEEPTEYTKEICEFCLMHGIDVIVGNHEHVIQKFDSAKKTAFCLGNFSSNYGIDRAPYDKNADCSIVLHAYISINGEVSFSFSVMLSKREKSCIVTTPLFDDYRRETEDKRKVELIEKNTKAVNRFANVCIEKVLPQEEYFLPLNLA